jgi:hypothetical protein
MCECDWVPFHHGDPCKNLAADHSPVVVSPALCMPCLYVCTKEQEDADDAEWEEMEGR